MSVTQRGEAKGGEVEMRARRMSDEGMAERSGGRMKRLGEDDEMEWRLEVEVEV